MQLWVAHFLCFNPEGITYLQQHYIQHLPYYFIFTLTSTLLGCKTDIVLHRLRRSFYPRKDSTSGSITENMINPKNSTIIKKLTHRLLDPSEGKKASLLWHLKARTQKQVPSLNNSFIFNFSLRRQTIRGDSGKGRWYINGNAPF